MPVLINQRREIFCQEIMNGVSTSKAYEIAGYVPNPANACSLRNRKEVQNRLTEIATQRDQINIQTNAHAMKAAGLSREWVISKLIENVEAAMDIGNGAVANRGLELLGRQFNLFIERHEVGSAGEFARMNDDELRRRALEDAQALGITGPALEVLMLTFQPVKGEKQEVE